MNKWFAVTTTAIILVLLASAGALLPGAAWGVAGPPIAIPPPALVPLNQIAVPEPPNLFQFVKNKPAAIKLGKAFFWDMQTGSDGVQACASCHFSAGADNRRKNTLNPGVDKVFGNTFFPQFAPNYFLQDADFPFHDRQNPDFQASPVTRDVNDVVGSQGVRFTDFLGIVKGSAVDNGTPVADPVFGNLRRVTGRNTPSNINAIFNFSNFWDGRAHFQFNGVNPFGPLDTLAGVWFNTGTVANPVLQKQKIAIQFASLASQATGPPLNETEMSYNGRTFPELGRKLLSLTPLGKQFVHPGDSELGPLSQATLLPGAKLGGNRGLTSNYSQMIKDAFQDNLWNAPDANTVSLPTKAFPAPAGEPFTQMEANFSLFWGLAIQLYEATLVADQTPFDRFLGGDQAALTPAQQSGFNTFFGAGRCSACHAATELSNASVSAAAFVTIATNALLEQMPVASGLSILYDAGFNNTAVRPTTDDIGRGGNSPFINSLPPTLPLPLSFAAQAELQFANSLPFAAPPLPANLPVNFPVANDGAFKVPGLRNVELTAPYFHNGGMLTLGQAVDFYTRGGNFPVANRNQLDVAIAEIGALQNNPQGAADLVAFMMSMTDERVRAEKAPFDHPELFIPEGDPEVLTRIPAKDAFGTAALPSNFRIDPLVSPTNQANLTVSGTNDVGATVKIQLNNGAAVPVTAPTATTWSAAIVLVEGSNSIAVTSVDAAAIQTILTSTVILDTIAPNLAINPVTTRTISGSQAITGTVETGVTPVVKVSTKGSVGTVTLNGANWSCPLTLLETGTNAVTVTATDQAGNITTATASIFVLGDGIFNGTRNTDISDAIRALRLAVGLITPTADDMLHGDVAPLGGPDGKIDIADALLIMKNVVGTVSLRTN
jgi:cytochrome c peroxidase